MTLSELRELVYDRLDEDPDEPLRYTQADVLDYLNDGIQMYSTRVQFVVTDTTLTQEPGRLFYDLPSDCVGVISVRSVTTGFNLIPVTFKQLDRDEYDPRWTRTESTRANAYLAFDTREIGLWPKSTAGGETYTLTYHQEVGSANLSADTDQPDLPEEYHEALVDYVVARALLSEGKIQEAVTYMQTWSQSIGDGQYTRVSIDGEPAVSTPSTAVSRGNSELTGRV